MYSHSADNKTQRGTSTMSTSINHSNSHKTQPDPNNGNTQASPHLRPSPNNPTLPSLFFLARSKASACGLIDGIEVILNKFQLFFKFAPPCHQLLSSRDSTRRWFFFQTPRQSHACHPLLPYNRESLLPCCFCAAFSALILGNSLA